MLTPHWGGQPRGVPPSGRGAGGAAALATRPLPRPLFLHVSPAPPGRVSKASKAADQDRGQEVKAGPPLSPGLGRAGARRRGVCPVPPPGPPPHDGPARGAEARGTVLHVSGARAGLRPPPRRSFAAGAPKLEACCPLVSTGGTAVRCSPPSAHTGPSGPPGRPQPRLPTSPLPHPVGGLDKGLVPCDPRVSSLRLGCGSAQGQVCGGGKPQFQNHPSTPRRHSHLSGK